MKILTVIGARPQFIKAAAVSRAVTERRAQGVDLTEIMVHTGQHYDENMSQIFFDELDIPRPDYNLEISHLSHGGMTGRMLEKLDEVIQKEAPDWVLVYGDTNSTIAGALAAVKLHVPVAHIEAGLRSYNRRMPEEINRVLTDHAADLLFAPTEIAVKNLLREGISGSSVHLVGDVMYDAALFYSSRAEEKSRVLQRLSLEPKKFILATVHRAENTDDSRKLLAILDALNLVSQSFPVILPLHPRTRSRMEAIAFTPYTTLRVIDPVGYLDMVLLEKQATLIATDSGGVQKEAFFHQVPCVTLRTETEWTELLELGWNRLAPPNSAKEIADLIQTALSSKPIMSSNPYGKGNSATLIAELLMNA